mmetsp:Transcript_21507/g.32024  ORF Transcript_21507/g.32024 Transcript_21507/m.32024 type:complete len:123 (-) Transcript_21507:257-625(-)
MCVCAWSVHQVLTRWFLRLERFLLLAVLKHAHGTHNIGTTRSLAVKAPRFVADTEKDHPAISYRKIAIKIHLQFTSVSKQPHDDHQKVGLKREERLILFLVDAVVFHSIILFPGMISSSPTA